MALARSRNPGVGGNHISGVLGDTLPHFRGHPWRGRLHFCLVPLGDLCSHSGSPGGHGNPSALARVPGWGWRAGGEGLDLLLAVCSGSFQSKGHLPALHFYSSLPDPYRELLCAL